MGRAHRKSRFGPARAIAAPVLLLSAVACGSSSQSVTTPTGNKCALQLQAERTEFPADGGSGTLRVVTNRECAWSASSEAGWLRLPPSSGGQGEGSITFGVEGNADPSARAAAITINDHQLRVSQQGRPCEFRLSSTYESVGASGGERRVDVSSSSPQCNWTASADVGWIAVAGSREGRGHGVVVFTVEAASGPRSGSLSIAGQQVRVEQTGHSGPPPGPGPGPGPSPNPGPCEISIAPTHLVFGASGGAGDVAITAPPGCAWTAESEVPWVTLASASAGSGAGVLSVRVPATDGPSRAGRLRIADRFVVVEQAQGCTYAVDPAAHRVPAGGSSAGVSIATAPGCTWSAATTVPWLTIAGAGAGSGPGRLEFRAASNSGPERRGSLTVAGRSIGITQASGCTYAVSPGRFDVGGAGSTVAASVTTAAGCSWTAASVDAWIGLTPASGTGPAQVQLTVGPNAAPPRSGNATIAGQTLAVHQESQCTYSLIPAAFPYDANGGHGAALVIVSGPCSWTSESTVDWIKVFDGHSGVGSGVTQFMVSPNPGAARSGTIRVGPQTAVVTQSAR